MAKKAYLGILTEIPTYTEELKTVSITADNISEYFDVKNGSYYFAGSGGTFTSNNGGVNSSTATTTLKAKQDIDDIVFSYSYSSEANYDKFTLKVAGTTVENAVSGATTSKSYSGSLTAGQTVEFTYAKDSSQSSNYDKCTFSNMTIKIMVKTQTSSETKSVARRCTKAYIGVETSTKGTVARKIKKAYIGISGIARPCFDGVDSVFANNTWEQIISACESGSVPDTWAVGDQKTMTINGTDYTIDIIGKNHDTYADGSGTAPLTFQLHDCYGTAYRMNSSRTNENGWGNTEMKNTTLPTVLALMPDEVQTAIKQVSKKYSPGGSYTNIYTASDKLFLLSEIEVFGTNEESVSGEGSQYDYYKQGTAR